MRTRTKINEFLCPELEDMVVDDVYFQQDGATRHTSGETISLLCEKFQGRAFSRNGDYNWALRSCDLTHLDFFLWGYVNDKVYADAPQLIQELKEKIHAVIDGIQRQMCENVMENFIKRAVFSRFNQTLWLRYNIPYITARKSSHFINIQPSNPNLCFKKH